MFEKKLKRNHVSLLGFYFFPPRWSSNSRAPAIAWELSFWCWYDYIIAIYFIRSFPAISGHNDWDWIHFGIRLWRWRCREHKCERLPVCDIGPMVASLRVFVKTFSLQSKLGFGSIPMFHWLSCWQILISSLIAFVFACQNAEGPNIFRPFPYLRFPHLTTG